MPPTLRSALPASLACILILAGCAGHPQRESSSATGSSPQTVAPEHARTERAPSQRVESKSPASATEAPAGPNAMVGVKSCDQYLSTYKACHRAAGIFAADQIDARYEMMRNTLLRDAQDPAKRGSLDQRCKALSTQLTEALHGKSCNVAPAASSSASGG